MMRVLDLFSGIGGFSLGLERTGGFETVAFCEIEPFPRRVLAKHWPGVPIYEDVRTLTADRLAADGIAVDVICGGFPCQDISTAGSGDGLAGERSGLWFEYARLVGEIRPGIVIVENVSALLHRGLDEVLGTLATLGYNAEWHCIPASYVGARHRRDRLWIVAHTNGQWELQPEGLFRNFRRWAGNTCQDVSDADGFGQSGPWWTFNAGNSEAYADREVYRTFDDRGWPAEPDVGRMAHGVPNGVDRLSALGNAVVPQIPELIGRAILASLKERQANEATP
jgi:DNA (cytosine-5)-methyltransferase 1